MDVRGPGGGCARVAVPEATGGVVDSGGWVAGGIGGEGGVDAGGDRGGGAIEDGPQSCDDVAVAGKLECRGEVDRFVVQVGSRARGGAGGQEGQVCLIKAQAGPRPGRPANWSPEMLPRLDHESRGSLPGGCRVTRDRDRGAFPASWRRVPGPGCCECGGRQVRSSVITVPGMITEHRTGPDLGDLP